MENFEEETHSKPAVHVSGVITVSLLFQDSLFVELKGLQGARPIQLVYLLYLHVCKNIFNSHIDILHVFTSFQNNDNCPDFVSSNATVKVRQFFMHFIQSLR